MKTDKVCVAIWITVVTFLGVFFWLLYEFIQGATE